MSQNGQKNTNDPGLPDSPDRSDLAVSASGWGCIKCQSGVCHLDRYQSLTVDSWSFVCSSRCTAALVVLLSVCKNCSSKQSRKHNNMKLMYHHYSALLHNKNPTYESIAGKTTFYSKNVTFLVLMTSLQ